MEQRTESSIAGVVSAVSVSHKRASLETIETASPVDSEHEMATLLEQTNVHEALVLATCNRIEWYVVTESATIGEAVLEDHVPADVSPAAQWLGHDAAIEHLHRVAAGLESMVIGEDEILGQLRSACRAAEDQDALGPLLEETIWKAIHLGERVRTETGINEGVTSLGRAAVMRASEETTIKQADALVVGAGEMASVAAHALAEGGVDRLEIVNRTPRRAEDVVATLPVKTTISGLDALDRAMSRADVVISATGSSTPLIDESILADVGSTIIVDLGQPRDVDPTATTDTAIEYFDLDDITDVTQAANASRQAAAEVAVEMVEDAVSELQRRLKRQQADDVIAAMYAGAEGIKRRELAEAKRRVSRGEDPVEEVLAEFADAMIGQLLAAPTKSLRDAAGDDDWETIQTALQLFDPEFVEGQVERTDLERSDEDAVGSSAQR